MAQKSLALWKKKVLTGSYKIDLDNQSYDCVDVSKDWIVYLSDKPWQESAGWGNAKDIYANWYGTYLDRIPRGNAARLGDIVVMNGSIGGGYGHTGVVIAIDGKNIQIAQQNTFTQQAVYTGWYDMYASYITGYLRPKIAFTEGDAPLEPYQRVTSDAVYYRKEAKRSGEVIELFDAGEIVNFKGFVRGESVDGNNIWFVGRFTGGYSHSSGYKDSSTNGLEDLTPVIVNPPALKDNERQVGTDAMNVRKSAKVAPDNVSRLIQPSTVITVKGYVVGQNVDGIDKWFVLDDGTFTWSGGYTNQSVANLSDLTPKPPEPTDPTQPVESDARIKAVVNKKNPNAPLNYTPTDLIGISGQYMREEAGNKLIAMINDAKTAGVSIVPSSGYRSFDTQTSVYNNYVAKDGQAKADTYSARPGYSEHQTGLAMDFGSIDDSFANTPAYKWLVDNGHKYGFVLRYPEGETAITGYVVESWHWRYVGVDVATDMKTKGVKTLEAYFNVKGGLYEGQEPTTPTDPKPTDPENPDEPKPPVTTPEAAASATKFITRIATQIGFVQIVVRGLAEILKNQVGITLDGSVIGWLTIAGTILLIAYAQFAYKIDAKFKWPF
jgi:LAS superfamily LD-carboxypeptidase LdcB